MAGYTVHTDPDKTSRAIGKEMPISPKDSREVCRMIRGKNVANAIRMLEDVISLEKPVRMARYNMGIAHKKGVGPGRFPKKSAQAILRVVESAKHNAEYKGLNSENMKVKVVTANLGKVIPGYATRLR